MLTPDNKQVVT